MLFYWYRHKFRERDVIKCLRILCFFCCTDILDCPSQLSFDNNSIADITFASWHRWCQITRSDQNRSITLSPASIFLIVMLTGCFFWLINKWVYVHKDIFRLFAFPWLFTSGHVRTMVGHPHGRLKANVFLKITLNYELQKKSLLF